VLAQEAGETEQTQGILKAQILGIDALGQGRPPGLGVFIAHLTALHIGAVLAEQQVDGITGLRILAEGLGALGLLAQDQLRLVGIEVGRGDRPGAGWP
jgi:hypothetical protein